jgi:hypothetical protein
MSEALRASGAASGNDSSAEPPGPNRTDRGTNPRLAPGIYLVRLAEGASVFRTRAVVLE